MEEITMQLGMKRALFQAGKAYQLSEIPIGAVLMKGDTLISEAHNTREQSRNPLHHAEILALEIAAHQLKDWRLEGTTLYVTTEPCPMCLGALLQARLDQLVFGCADPKRAQVIEKNQRGDFIFPSLKNISSITGNNHKLLIQGGVMEAECAQLLKDFFIDKR